MTSNRSRAKQGKKPTGESAASVNLRRRRLIKGAAAAAPAIFTLYSGSALANLSSRQCVAESRDAFTGEEEFAGEDHVIDGFVRLAHGPGIHVVLADPDDDDGKFLLPGRKTSPKTEGKWLIMVMDKAGVPHYIEAGYQSGQRGGYGNNSRGNNWGVGNTTPGISWQEVVDGLEWLTTEDSGSGIFGSALKFIDPSSDPSSPVVYEQDFSAGDKTIEVLACVDDDGNIVSAYPQECDALGLQPPSGSCWCSIGTESLNAWWG